jgi:hypothetical protein
MLFDIQEHKAPSLLCDIQEHRAPSQ